MESQIEMQHTLSDARYFHITQKVDYHDHKVLEVGDEFDVGEAVNPFFRFYERGRKYSQGGKHYTSLDYLIAVLNNEAQHQNPLQLALDVANYFRKLARELIMEEVRRDVAPNAPSRQRCLWACSSLDLARKWKAKEFGGQGRILEIAVIGTAFETDSTLLPRDSEPLASDYQLAKRYWRGDRSEQCALEVLISGHVTVMAEHD